ncbi:MAG: deoxyribonuclease IV [Desulfurococcales archaeon]|nr:deoxyribonuclease IV [Desulfurococcales archaeon]
MPRLRFGPAGKPLSFKGSMEKVPEYLHKIGLDALEYEAVRGVRISEEKARLLGEEAVKYDIVLSMHAPYYINLASKEREKTEASRRRLFEAMRASHWMNAYAVVFHPGYYKGWSSKEVAVKKVIDQLKKLEDEIKTRGYTRPWIAPETTGKDSQVGSVDDIIEICSSVGKCRPTVDWAHLYARSQGRDILSIDDVVRVIERIEKELGSYAVKPLHTHFSKIEYGKGGEKMHHTLREEEYGPDWIIVCKAYLMTGIDAVIISESPILEEDALYMIDSCREVLKDGSFKAKTSRSKIVISPGSETGKKD